MCDRVLFRMTGEKTAVEIVHLSSSGLNWAQRTVAEHHYLHAPVLARACPEGWAAYLPTVSGPVGCLIVGRPQATRCYPWYGSVEDVASGRCEVTRWQVLALARVWIDPRAQPGGQFHLPSILPGFIDRHGTWRSTLASSALRQLSRQVGYEYLLARPPVYLDEPYEHRWLLSYCDTSKHRGTIYRAAGWELYRVNENGIQTWRTPLPSLTTEQHAVIADASRGCARARRFRAERERDRSQLRLDMDTATVVGAG